MPMVYSVFGLCLRADVPVPGLAFSPGMREIDVRIWLKSTPNWVGEKLETERVIWYSSPCQNESGEPTLRVWEIAGGDYFHMVYSDATEFIVNRAGTEIWGRWPDELSLEDTATYLLGPVIGFVLIVRGITCLHASAIAIDDKA